MKRVLLVLFGGMLFNCSDDPGTTTGLQGGGGTRADGGGVVDPSGRTCQKEETCDSACEDSCTTSCIQAGVPCDCSHCCSPTAACYYSHSYAEAADPACTAGVCTESNGVGTISANVRGHSYVMTSNAAGVFTCTRDGASIAPAPSAGGIGGMSGTLPPTGCNQIASHWPHCCGW